MNVSEAKPYEFDWDGGCIPAEGLKDCSCENRTFSVGIFQWIPKKDGKGLKRGKAIKRIRGYSSNPEEVYRKAEGICKGLNEQWELGGKG